MRAADSGLVRMAEVTFGDWATALSAAGLDPLDAYRDFDHLSGKGIYYHQLCRALFAELRPTWTCGSERRTTTGRRCRPDAIDPTTGAWIDFKLAEWGGSATDTIRKYRAHCPRLLLIYLLGNGRRCDYDRTDTEFVSVFSFASEASRSTPRTRTVLRRLRALSTELSRPGSTKPPRPVTQ